MKLLKKLVVFVLVLRFFCANEVQAARGFEWVWGLGSGLAGAGSSVLTAVSGAGDATVAATAAAASTAKATSALADLLSPVVRGVPEDLVAKASEDGGDVDHGNDLIALQTVSGCKDDAGMVVSRLAYEMNAVAGAQMAKLDAMFKPVLDNVTAQTAPAKRGSTPLMLSAITGNTELDSDIPVTVAAVNADGLMRKHLEGVQSVLANVAVQTAQAKKPDDSGLMTLQDLTSDAAHATVPVSNLVVVGDAVAKKHLNRMDRIADNRVRQVAAIVDPLSATLTRLATTADKLVTDLYDPLDRLEETLRNTYQLTAQAKKVGGAPMMLSDRTGKEQDGAIPVSVLAANLDGIMQSKIAAVGDMIDQKLISAQLAATRKIAEANVKAKLRLEYAHDMVKKYALTGAVTVAGVVVVYVTYKYFAKRSALKAAKAAAIPTFCSFIKRGSINKAALNTAINVLGKQGVANIEVARKRLAKARKGLCVMTHAAVCEQAMIKLLSKQSNVAWLSANVIAQSYKDCFASEKLITALRWLADQRVPLVVLGADSLMHNEEIMNWFTLAAENNQVIMNCYNSAPEEIVAAEKCDDMPVAAQA
jgi:hypothetical protein